MAYDYTMEKQPNGIFKKVVKESYKDKTHNTAKMNIRAKIEEDVFDIYDSVADNSKLISLLFSLLKRIYHNSLTEEQKTNIPDYDRALIEGTFEIFSKIKTRADEQFERDGPDMIQTILNRQGDIGKIIEKELSK